MMPIDRAINQRKAVLLFYQEAERDSFIRHDRYLKRIVRPLYNLTHRRRKRSGFRTSFDLLTRALQDEGLTVRVNDYASARLAPHYPVGLVGSPQLLDRWRLPNPAVLGPSLYDHPMQAPDLMKDPRFRICLLPSAWARDLFGSVYGDACAIWFAGIDLADWPDTAGQRKDLDFLVYDKIMWDRERQEDAFLKPILQTLERRGLRYECIRYMLHDQATYRALLARSRSMLFLCEHESQGIAYQEALASNVPILAWDNGFWLDPLARRFGQAPVPASSVPYFSLDCGERFSGLQDFAPALERFLARRSELSPRRFVSENLSPKQSARVYAHYYFSLLPEAASPDPARSGAATRTSIET